MWPEWYGDSLQRPLMASSQRVPDTYALYLANARGPADLRMRMWGDGGAGFAFGVRLGFGVGLGFAFGLGAIALGLVDLAVRGLAVLGVAALRLMDFLDVFRFAMSPPGVWLVGWDFGAVGGE